jgi:hypothetical protein
LKSTYAILTSGNIFIFIICFAVGLGKHPILKVLSVFYF